jgi:hypothetical protein
MTLLRTLGDDLVEKRLWPIAAALLAAIVAVPLVLSGGRQVTTSSGGPAIAPGSGRTAKVHLDTTSPPSVQVRSSKARNPFTSHSMPRVAPPAAATTQPAPATTISSGIAPKPATSVSPPAQTTTATRTTAIATTPKKTVATRHEKLAATATKYRVAWRWGVDGSQRGSHNVARLSALPSPSAPALIYLGLLKRKASMVAMFLVEPGVQLEGDGRCLPDPNACHILKMRAHQSELVTAGGVRFRLDVAHIQRGHTTPAAAKRLRARESKAGRKALRAAIAAGVPGVGTFVFNHKKGLLAPYVAAAKG